MTEIRIVRRDQYGRTVFHPANDAAKLMARIAGTKTLTRSALNALAGGGYEIIVSAPSWQVDEIG